MRGRRKTCKMLLVMRRRPRSTAMMRLFGELIYRFVQSFRAEGQEISVLYLLIFELFMVDLFSDRVF